MPGKKAVTESPEPSNLRRSTRSTRGSIRPLVDLSKGDEDEDEECELTSDKKQTDEVESEEELSVSVKKETETKKGATRRDLKKKEPVRGKPASRATTTKRKSEKESLEDAPTVKAEADILNSDNNLADLDGTDTFYELSEMELKEINHAFDMNRMSDIEELLDSEKLKTAVRSLGFEPRGDEIERLMKTFSNKSGKINRDGFHKIMALKFSSSPGTRQNNLNDEISRVFNLLDLDKTGLITLDNLKSISKELSLDVDFSEEDLLEMLAEADLDGDGKMNKDEFETIMKKTKLY